MFVGGLDGFGKLPSAGLSHTTGLRDKRCGAGWTLATRCCNGCAAFALQQQLPHIGRLHCRSLADDTVIVSLLRQFMKPVWGLQGVA